MSKKQKKLQMKQEGLHEIKNKKRPRMRKCKRGEWRLSPKRKRRALKIGAISSVLVVAFVAVFAVGALFNKNIAALEVDEGFATVSYPLPEGKTPVDFMGKDLALQNIGYLNNKFKQQENWYSEMHGTALGTVAGITVEQSVNTYKQYDDDILIMADITTSNLINEARQFCYVGDDVLWRTPANGDTSKWTTGYANLDSMSWSSGEPYAHLTLHDFKYGNGKTGSEKIDSHGLPGTELTVYIINEETLLDATDVKDNGDGTYTQTYYLDPAVDKAPTYYRYQMAFTGNLTDLPTFSSIEVTYTFDANWQVLSSDIKEYYRAPMGVWSDCVSVYHTEYEYNTTKAESNAYDTYFNQYADKPAFNAPVSKDPTAIGCLTTAFSSVLGGESTFDLALDLNGTKVNGVVTVDLGDMEKISLRAKLGNIGIWYDGAKAYLSYGDLKASMSVSELMGLLGELLPKDNNADLGASLDLNSLLSSLGNGTFEFNETSASLSSNLELFGLTLPVDFSFRIDEEGTVSLDKVAATIDVAKDFAVGAQLSFGDKPVAELTAVEKAEFVELMPYVTAVKDLVTSDMRVDLQYAGDGFSVEGYINFTMQGGVALSGEITLKAGEEQKTVALGFTGGDVYFNLDGIKLRANVQEAIKLVSQFLTPAPGETEGEAAVQSEKPAFDLAGVLAAVFSDDFAKLFELGEEDSTLRLALNGTELLKTFGVNFELGDVVLTVNAKGISANCGSVSVSAAACEPFAVDTEGYTDIVVYADRLIKLFGHGYLAADIDFTYTDLKVNGTVNIALDPLAAAADLTLSYKGAEKKISVGYPADGSNEIYLTVDKLKVKASVSEAVSIISQFISLPETEKGTMEILQTVLSIDFGTLLQVGETTEVKPAEGETTEGEAAEAETITKLNVTLQGTELLRILGVNFELGEVVLTVGEEDLTVSGFGANIAVKAGEAFTVDTKDYLDVTPIIKKLPEVINAQGIALAGNVKLTAGETNVDLVINKGALSWANGINVYLNCSVIVGGTQLDLDLSVTDTGVKLAYGTLGVAVDYADLTAIKTAVTDLYNRVAEVANSASAGDAFLPVVGSFDELLALLKGSDVVTGTMQSIDIAAIINGLTLQNTEGGAEVVYGGLTVKLTDETPEGFLGAALAYTSDKVGVQGALHIAALQEAVPAMPAINYLGVTEFENLLDYVGAAVNTLAQENIHVNATGTVTSKDAKYTDGIKYDLSASLDYYSGSGFPFRLDVNGKTLVVNSDLYLHANVSLVKHHADDDSLYLDFTVLDADLNGEKDGTLDFYVAVSKLEMRDPLRLYAPADEIMTLLSGACAMFGIDNSILNDYMISKWLTLDEVGQLKGLGDSLKQLIAGLINPAPAAVSEGVNEAVKKDFISAIAVGDTEFTLRLSSKDLFGLDNAEDLAITLGKAQGENGSYLTMVSLANIYNGDGTECTSVSVNMNYDATTVAAPAMDGCYNLNGIDAFIKTIAGSVTHKVPVDGEVISGEQETHDYVLNENFYIDGSIVLDINAIDILKEKLNIKVVAFSITIDENGVWGVNVRFEYDAIKVLGITAINGNTQVDLTGKDNMVYIKRVQTTDADKKPFAKPVTIYRAMPLANFAKDLINQAGFLFNLGSKITDLLAGIEMGGSGTTTEEVDLGTTVKNILTSFVYKTSAEGESWVITLNGAGLTGGTLGNIVITFGSDGKGKLRTLTANTSLSTTGISMVIDANLTYRNPCGVIDTGVKDITTDIAEVLTDGMSYKLGNVDWTATTFIEGEFTSVDYILMGDVIKTQNIVISTGAAGDAQGTVYGTLAYPDLTPYNTEKGYRAEWVTYYGEGDPLPDSRQIYAQYKALTYHLTFKLKDNSIVRDYLYDDDSFALPFEENEVERIAYFTDAEGNEYRTAEDLKNLSGDTLLTAVYEMIEYTVTFTVGEETIVQTAHYGDEIEYPVSPERVGYTFDKWDSDAQTVTGNMEITALWTPNEYTVTLVSKYEIEGYTWTANGEGSFTTSFTFVYDSDVSLPRGARHTEGEKQYALRSFCTAEGGESYFDKLPNVTQDTVFTAQWEELGFDITFVGRDGTVVDTLNYHGGETIPADAIPKIAARDGYTSFWHDASGNKIVDGYHVTGEATFTVKDEANTYSVKLVSTQPYEGFTAENDVYIKTLSYVYDGAAVVPEALGDIHGYWFKGFYTEADGKGEKVESIDHILEDTTVYAWWQDNTVKVRIYSDLKFEGSTQDNTKGGFYKECTFNDNYDISDSIMPTVAGYKTLALFHLGDTWETVDNVLNLNGEDLWIFWIQDIKVKITEFYTNDFMGGKQYNVGGTVEGALPYGQMSNHIYDTLNMKESTKTEATFYIRGATAGEVLDNCGGKKTIEVKYADGSRIGTFLGTEMNSGSYNGTALGSKAFYGGVVLTKTFEYGGKSIPVTDGAMVSLNTYTVSYLINGVTEKVEGVHADCPFDEYDCTTYVDELAEANGIEVPLKRGYKGVWAHEAVVGSMVVEPVYTANASVAVLFESDREIEGFTKSGDKYVYECSMLEGTLVEFYNENELLQRYTVSQESNLFTVPSISDTQIWGVANITEEGATLRAQRNVDMVTYSSEVAFDFDGVQYSGTLTQEITQDYTMITPTAEGYTFRGWWQKVDGVWTQVTSLSPTAGEVKSTVTLSALWEKSALEITIKASKSKSGWWDYSTTVQVTSVNYGLVGAFVSDSSVQTSINYHYYIGTATVGQSYATDSQSQSLTWNNSFNVPNSAEVTATLKFVDANGKVIYTMEEAKASSGV